MTEKCYYCESIETNYCSLCSNWFCDKCKIRYDKRIISMIKEKFAKKGLEWLTGKEYDERKEAELKKAEDDYKAGKVYTTKELTGLELTPEELKSVERAEVDYKAGRFLTTKELNKELGLDEEEEK